MFHNLTVSSKLPEAKKLSASSLIVLTDLV